MTAGEPLGLLPPAGESATDWAPLVASLSAQRLLLTPEVAAAEDHPVILEEPALATLAAISAAGLDRAALLGLGLGAMVAMTVAAGFGSRVSALVLSPVRRPESTALLSLHNGIRQLVPAATAQRLGMRPGQVLDLLDQVRPLDYRGWVQRVEAPTLVLVGERDVANIGASIRLAGALTHARLEIVPGAGAGWQRDQPDRTAELVAAFLDRL